MILTIDVDDTKDLIIKPGQKVDFDTPLKEKKYPQEIKILIAQFLDIPPQKIFVYLKKVVGEKIKKGELLAEKKGFFSRKKCISQYDGIIKEINHQEGFLLIESHSDIDEVTPAFFKGEIVALESNKIKIKVGHYKSFELKQATDDFGGKIFYLNSSIVLSEEETIDKIIVSQSISSYGQTKLETLGIKGFVILYPLPEKTFLPWAKLKNITDWQTINDLNFPYCIINKKGGKIYFYS